MKKIIVLFALTILAQTAFTQNPDLNEELFNAVKADNIEEVKELIKKGADLNAKNNSNVTALHFACKNIKGLEMVKLLLEKGADINVISDKGGSLLHVACKNPNGYEIAKMLIEKGADVNAKDKYKNTALHIAVLEGIYIRNEEYLAANFNTIKLLTEKGADINAIDEAGKTPLSYAKWSENIVDYLIRNGAE